MKKDHRIKKRIKCCGKLTKIYFSDETQYCSRCHYEYDFSGKNLGYFGSGLNKEDYEKKYYKKEI